MADCEKVTPYGGDSASKTGQVREMFDNIAPAYDFMNRAMTLGVDKSWRRALVSTVASRQPQAILDVATGTGDLAILLARTLPQATVTGIDLSEGMTSIGNDKVAAAGLSSRVTLTVGDCLELPMPGESFDAVTVAYGVRNFQDLAKGYREMARVLRPGGILAVLELSTPTNPAVKPFYSLYTRAIIPTVGRLVSHDTRADSYLPQSIAAVPQGDEMLALMTGAGLHQATFRRFTFGVCTLYTAYK